MSDIETDDSEESYKPPGAKAREYCKQIVIVILIKPVLLLAGKNRAYKGAIIFLPSKDEPDDGFKFSKGRFCYVAREDLVPFIAPWDLFGEMLTPRARIFTFYIEEGKKEYKAAAFIKVGEGNYFFFHTHHISL
jgi:hypothetical protein